MMNPIRKPYTTLLLLTEPMKIANMAQWYDTLQNGVKNVASWTFTSIASCCKSLSGFCILSGWFSHFTIVQLVLCCAYVDCIQYVICNCCCVSSMIVSSSEWWPSLLLDSQADIFWGSLVWLLKQSFVDSYNDQNI